MRPLLSAETKNGFQLGRMILFYQLLTGLSPLTSLLISRRSSANHGQTL
ncbi:hypothetical protein LINPERHAP2_LOCUS14877 [Linum perenne]